MDSSVALWQHIPQVSRALALVYTDWYVMFLGCFYPLGSSGGCLATQGPCLRQDGSKIPLPGCPQVSNDSIFQVNTLLIWTKEIKPMWDWFMWFLTPCLGGQNTKIAIVHNLFRLSFHSFRIFTLHLIERKSCLSRAVTSALLALGDANALPPNSHPCAWYINSHRKMHHLHALCIV